MWFVIHVKPGTEEKAVEILRLSPKSDGLEEVFSPMAVGVRRERGELVESSKPMLSGCVFAVAPSKWELRACMRRADGVDALFDGERSFEEMTDDEAEFINVFTDAGERTVRMSEGVVDRGRIVVNSGPLVGREGEIRKYSHRNRWAYLDTSVAGTPARAAVGLRVTRKDAASAQAT